jgi:hypothetical protein
MHFIERLFGFSPDAGSGLSEAIALAGLLACLVRAFSLHACWSRKNR